MTDRTMWLRLALSSALAVTAALAFGALAGAQAQNYPNKPVRLVLPYAPGGIIDYVGRTLAQKLTENLGQPVVAENRPGGGGVLGTDSVARSAPDGYTLVLMDPAIIINPTLQADVPYDVFRNLQTVSIISSSPEVLVISPILPVKTFPEESSISLRPASARRRISPARCSSSAPASTRRISRTRASVRPTPI